MLTSALIEKWQYDQPLGIKPVPGADVVCQSKLPLGLGHVASIEAQRRQTIIAWKELLGFAGFPGHLDGLMVAAGGQVRPAVALVNLPEHNQWNGKMLALIELSVEFNRLFGGGHAFIGTSVGEGATGDGIIGKKARLKAEIADTARGIKPATAHLDRLRGVDHRVEHAEIGVTPAGCAEKAGSFGGCDTSLHLAHRLPASTEPRQGKPPGVQCLRGCARRST